MSTSSAMVWRPSPLHMPRHPRRGGDELAVDHQEPVVVAAQHGLHQHGPPFGLGGLEGGGDAVPDVIPTVTPRPWLPSSGLMTTG